MSMNADSIDFNIRPFVRADVADLLQLMRGLAAFEGYLEDFAVSETDLVTHGLEADPPLFRAWVAERAGALVGMAVTYDILWTYERKLRVSLKELFVAKSARGSGAGRALMDAVVEYARRQGASGVHWTVMRGNTPAEAFYTNLGGAPDRKWENWSLKL